MVPAKLDGAGNHLWSKRFGDAVEQEPWGLAVNSACDLVLTGSFSGAVDFGGGPVAGIQGGDIFLAVLDGAGGHVWSTSFGASGGQEASAVAVDGADNILLTGRNHGTLDSTRSWENGRPSREGCTGALRDMSLLGKWAP